MKKTLTSFLILGTAGLMSAGLISCRKDKTTQTITQYDQEQIQNYIKSQGLTGFQRDLSGGDTTGIYYKITRQGTGAVIDYPSDVAYVYTIRTLDGSYTATDTIANHAYSYVGHIGPKGLMLSFINILKNVGTQARLLIPSRLAYGTNGSTATSPHIPGNASMDFYINTIDITKNSVLDTYDDQVIQSYMKTNGLTGYTTVTVDGAKLYYKVAQVGTGTDHVTDHSEVGIQYTSTMLNGTQFSQVNYSDTTAYAQDIQAAPRGWQEGFKYVTKGAKLSLIMPSRLAYGLSSPFTTLPQFSCVRTEFNIMYIKN
ncbi:hypothetical protein MUY27_11675 [Mucilaginibacter sp. RS28]|uniref:Peptidyl-prolyl cis-trans isomerase n=1 Tax=Mucilaginibacter straminoryzae TaxID=2932774 RepID=A0A9X1X3A6_9SPHI|nr:FKBP-type peptidyl-prolyl cis-trans isomerase [Mucilaginibacter straminoryzae]MCJ8210369.1 hypothetical protein [Mucilaginibacter straminoryzae]